MNCIRDPSPKQQHQRNPSKHRPESVLEVPIETPGNSSQEPAERARFDRHRPPQNMAATSHRSASPFVKQPKIIKNEGDHALYVKLSDLPEGIREHLHIDIGTDNSEADTEEASSQPNDNVGGFARGGDPTTGRRPPPNMSFDEPKRLSAQPTVEEIQMCFAQIDLAILMDGKTRPRPARPTSPKRAIHQHKPCDEDPPPPRPAHKTQSPSPRRKDKWTAQTNPSPPSSPPPPAKEYNGYTGFNSDESLSKARHPSIGKKDGIGISSSATRKQTMDDLLQSVGRRQQEKTREETKKKQGNNTRPVATKDGSRYNDDDDDDEEEEELLDGIGGSSGKRRGHNDSMSFCGVGSGLSMIRNDFKSKLKHMHAMAATSPISTCTPIHERSKKMWPKDGAAHHVRYKSSWSGTSQEEYQVDPNDDDSDNQ